MSTLLILFIVLVSYYIFSCPVSDYFYIYTVLMAGFEIRTFVSYASFAKLLRILKFCFRKTFSGFKYNQGHVNSENRTSGED